MVEVIRLLVLKYKGGAAMRDKLGLSPMDYLRRITRNIA